MVFLHTSCSINTVTNTVQKWAGRENTDDEDSDESPPRLLDHRGMLVAPKIPLAPKLKLTPRDDSIAARSSDHQDIENVWKLLDKEESTDIVETGGFSTTTVADAQDEQLYRDYEWKPRRSRSERARLYSHWKTSTIWSETPL